MKHKPSLGFSLFLLLAALPGCGGLGTSDMPTITSQPSSVAVSEGGAFTLSVGASGTGLTYQWTKDGTAISGATSSSHTVSSATSADAGSYYVTVTNSAGSVNSSTVTVSVAVASE